MEISTLKISNTLTFSFIGPPLSRGPLPTVFYFALSAKDSLETDPYNQPVRFLQSNQLRLFTATIPGHEEGLKPENALTLWAEKISRREDILTPFFKEVNEGIHSLKQKNLIAEGKLGAMGLSRGAFVASHIAALCPDIRFILGFAPLTSLSQTTEFQGGPDVSLFDLKHLTSKLYDRMIRFYIGNLDSRVGTKRAFELIQALAMEAKNHRIRPPPMELMINPSIGYRGHGTAPHIFLSGANWIKHLWHLKNE